MAYHQARKAKDLMDEAERRAIADSEAAELAGSGSDDGVTTTTADASEGAAAE
jgi:DNA-directed RNA polymerase subunit beta'